MRVEHERVAAVRHQDELLAQQAKQRQLDGGERRADEDAAVEEVSGRRRSGGSACAKNR